MGFVLKSLVNYQENDPTTPDLTVAVEIPPLPNPCPPFMVLNFTGADGPPGSVEHQAADVYVSMVTSITYVQSMLERPIVAWPSLTQLIANPRSGRMFNAYYDRYYFNFFFDTDPTTNKIVYTCDSTDVVGHEFGHAILDSVRPELWAIQSVEIQAFHESFGDINAILLALNLPSMIHLALNETGGNLKHDNVISLVAEQMGLAVFHAMGGNPGDRSGHALRNANNSFMFSIPETLPTIAPPDQLAGEPHSFSRIFTGAWWDAFVNIYNNERKIKSQEEALAVARDKIAHITYNAIRYAPVNARFYQSVLSAMLAYDQKRGLGCTEAIKAGFTTHGIIPSANFTMTDVSLPEVKQMFGVTHATDTVRIADFSGQKNNPLHDCLVVIATAPQASDEKNVESLVNLQEAIHSAQYSLDVIADHDRVQNGLSADIEKKKEFSIADDKLLRNFFCCRKNLS